MPNVRENQGSIRTKKIYNFYDIFIQEKYSVFFREGEE
jgi:hypothetical protein